MLYSILSKSVKYRQAAIAQLVERRIGNAEVTGPIPVSSFKIKDSFGDIRASFFVSLYYDIMQTYR